MHSQRILNAISFGISMHIVSLHCFGVNAWVQERTEPITYPQILPPWNKWQRRLKGIWIIQIYQKTPAKMEMVVFLSQTIVTFSSSSYLHK